MRPFLDDYVRLLADERYIEREDILAIRTVLDEELVIDGEFVAKLLEIDRVIDRSPEWVEFLAETITKCAHSMSFVRAQRGSDTLGVRRKWA
jgi:hypothetical protein